MVVPLLHAAERIPAALTSRVESNYSAGCSAPVKSFGSAEAVQGDRFHCTQAPSKQHGPSRRSGTRPFAGRGRGRVEEDDVEFDNWESDGQNSKTLSGTAQKAWSAVNSFSDRVVDLAMDFAPDTLSRSVVETIVKAGLALGAIILVRSILGSIVLFGTIILALYVGTRVLGLDGTSGGRQRPGGDERPRTRASGRQSKGLPSGKASSDLMDVWFEPKEGQRGTARQRES